MSRTPTRTEFARRLKDLREAIDQSPALSVRQKVERTRALMHGLEATLGYHAGELVAEEKRARDMGKGRFCAHGVPLCRDCSKCAGHEVTP